MVLGPRFFHPPSPESSVSSQTMQKDSIEKAYWLLKSINPGETFHLCLYSFTKNYSYGSTPMSRGKCLPRIKMEGGLWLSGGQSANYVTFNNYVFSFHCWVCYQILIQKPLVSFWHKLAYLCSYFLEEIFKRSISSFQGDFLIWTCNVTSNLKGLLASVVSIFFLRWPLAQRESLATELAFWLLNFPILRSFFTLAN